MRAPEPDEVLIAGPLGGDVTFEVRVSSRPNRKQWEHFVSIMDAVCESFDPPKTPSPPDENVRDETQ